MTDATAIDPRDERPHPIGDHGAWSESYYFFFVDHDTGIGAFTRMGWRPNDGWADGLHAVYLGGDRIAWCYARKDHRAGDAQDLEVGGLKLGLHEPFTQWTIDYHGATQDIADSPVLVTPRKERPSGYAVDRQLNMTVTFDALADPFYAAHGQAGHFEQAGRVTGTIRMGDESWNIANGYGVRDKSWGPRTWQGTSPAQAVPDAARASGAAEADGKPRPFTTWFAMNFGADLSLAFGAGTAPDGTTRGAGWFQRDARNQGLTIGDVQSDYRADSILHRSGRFTAAAEDGTNLDVAFEVPTVCVTKIAMPGGATLVNEGIAKFKLADGRVGWGIAEYWHAVRR